MHLTSILPHKVAVRLGGFLGLCVWALSKKKVDEAEKRCVEVLGVGVTKARKIVRDSYVNLGRGFSEFVLLPKLREGLFEYVTVHGEENLKSAFSQGKGVILLTAHIGNWEFAAAYLGLSGYPMNAIGAEQRDERITNLIEDLRASCGVKTIGKGFDLKSALACLKRGELLGVLLDQDFRDKGVVVPFLGVDASTPYGPLKMADKLGALIVPLFIIRREDGIRHDLYFLEPLQPKGSKFEDSLEESAAMCNDVISQWILRFPGQWMWLYDRWASTRERKR
jgi:KDO2-lipid IV(A) lauroyltransferase